MPPGSRVIRVMPNTGSQVAEGAAAYCCGKHTLPEDGATVDALMSCVGLCEEMPEKYIDIICGVAGSGIAFVSLILYVTLCKVTFLICLMSNQGPSRWQLNHIYPQLPPDT